MTDKLTLISKDFQGSTVRAVDHPEHGPLLMARDVLAILGYPLSGGAVPVLDDLGVPRDERSLLNRKTLCFEQGLLAPQFSAGTFLTRKGVNLLLVSSTKPKAKEFREWLAGDVVNAIVDTGGYLLNEAARDTAKADTRTTVPLPGELGGAYAALIEEKQARIAAEMETLEAWKRLAQTDAEKLELQVKLMEQKANLDAATATVGRLEPMAKLGEGVVEVERSVAKVARMLPGRIERRAAACLMPAMNWPGGWSQHHCATMAR